MSHSILEKDVDIRFPQVTVLKASAGSGKTYSLTERFVQFLLSSKIPQNHLKNILAITFSNNAAKEMKERILSWLKDIYFGDSNKIEALSEIVSLRKEHLPAKAGAAVDEILRNYTEFQVKTIDSFMTSIYKASAIDLGYSPDFEIVMAPETMMAYAFNRFLRGVRKDTPEAEFLEELLEIILDSKGGESAYLWDPSKDFLEETVALYHKLSGIVSEAKIVDAGKEIESVKKEIRDTAEDLNHLIEKSGLTKSKGSSFYKILEVLRRDDFPDLIGKGVISPPVLKPKKPGEASSYETISKQWDLLGDEIKRYIELYGKTYYTPYLKTYEAFKDIVEDVKRREGTIFIHDINKKLSDYLNHEIVPDVYFRIGETIYHYLVDEFQDTSPIQWNNLFPLIENSLSQGGSLFTVGDTKQAIYRFRNADYGIMKRLESKTPFSSAYHNVKELEINYRSLEGVVNFSKGFFQKVVAGDDKYREPASRSGLIDYEQKVKEDQKGSGYVEVIRCEKKDDEIAEKQKVQGLVTELKKRGYSYSDMAILAHRNEDVVNVTTWLNEMDVPFISYSSLDIRTRKLTAEIVGLLSFLDSPPDDLSFAGFILGDIFAEALESEEKAFGLEALHEFFFRNRKNAPLYKAFQQEFPKLWEVYFEELFKSTGYLPLYDLVSEIYRIYKVFDHFTEEEATLIKILEVIKNFEGEGRNNPGDFLRYAFDEEAGESDWTIDVPAGINAIKVMTIHKAKGLGFPVVILLMYEETTRGFQYILDEGIEGAHLLKMSKKISEASPFLGEKYGEERLKDLVNKLNTLYVGFTRAEDELYIIGVQGKKNQFPLDLLQTIDPQIGSKNPPRPRPSKTTQVDLELYHYSGPFILPFAAIEELNLEEKQRGEFIHRVLYFIDDLGEGIESELERIIRRVNDELRTDYPVFDTKKDLLEFLRHEEVRPFFQTKPGRLAKKEQDFSGSGGDLLRMDRVVIDEDRISVIDYKTGSDKKAEKAYISQLKNYVRILEQIYPGKIVEGVIAYVDLKETTLLS
jgi:ATP-dependent exoDNAse (exonuclease V) beta subunit